MSSVNSSAPSSQSILQRLQRLWMAAPVLFAYILALYLILISIIATQVYEEKPIVPGSNRLDTSLNEIGIGTPISLREASQITTASNQDDVSSTTSKLDRDPANRQISGWILTVSKEINNAINNLSSQPKDFSDRAAEMRSNLTKGGI
jgi:hypothetical protein